MTWVEGFWTWWPLALLAGSWAESHEARTEQGKRQRMTLEPPRDPHAIRDLGLERHAEIERAIDARRDLTRYR